MSCCLQSAAARQLQYLDDISLHQVGELRHCSEPDYDEANYNELS